MMPGKKVALKKTLKNIYIHLYTGASLLKNHNLGISIMAFFVFRDHSVYYVVFWYTNVMAISNILLSFGVFPIGLVYCIKENLGPMT
jgi:hypothetical protein